MKKDRLANIDLFKIACIFSVIVLHISSHNAFDKTYNYIYYKNFEIFNFYNMITRFCVPGFIMISGMFLLNKDITIKVIFTKYILRMIILYFIFSLLYTINFYIENNTIDIIDMFFKGYYHLWYVYLIIGLYLVTPILRKIVIDDKITIYFLILCFIFSSVIPFIVEIFNLNILKIVVNHLNVHLSMGYVGYYVAGYYLSKHKINDIIFYILGFIGFISNYIMFNIIKYPLNIYDMVFRLPTTCFQVIAIYLFFKNLKVKNNSIIINISKLTSGIYFIHLFLIQLLFKLFPYYIYDNCIVNTLFISLIIYIISLLITVTLKQLPFLKKYL